jgi:uncharacterized protein (DUF2461 family)
MSDGVFKKTCVFEGEKLMRPPHGFNKNHPMIEWLQYKDFTFFTKFKEKEACSGGFMEKVTSSFKAASPLMSFLTLAMELDYDIPQGVKAKTEQRGREEY